jgi:hypothetical protein
MMIQLRSALSIGTEDFLVAKDKVKFRENKKRELNEQS